MIILFFQEYLLLLWWSRARNQHQRKRAEKKMLSENLNLIEKRKTFNILPKDNTGIYK